MISETIIELSGHDGAVDVTQFRREETNYVLLDEESIAEIVRARFEVERFGFENLMDAIELWRIATKDGKASTVDSRELLGATQ
jgi:hypothetical protein